MIEVHLFLRLYYALLINIVKSNISNMTAFDLVFVGIVCSIDCNYLLERSLISCRRLLDFQKNT